MIHSKIKLIILLCAISVISGCSNYYRNASNKHEISGTTYASQSNFEMAKKEYQASVRLYPYNEPSKLALQVINDLYAGKISNETVCHLFKAGEYNEKRKFDQGLLEINKAITGNPDYALGYYEKGRISLKVNDFDKAIADFDTAIAKDPDLIWPYLGCSYAYFKKGDYEKAISNLDRATQIDPNLPYLNYLTGIILSGQDKYDYAISSYNRAIKIDPLYADAYSARGRAYCDIGGYKNAVSDFSKAIKLGQVTPYNYFYRGYAYLEIAANGKNHTANFSADPNNPFTQQVPDLSFTVPTQHNLNPAVSDFTEAIRLDPKYYSCYVWRAFAYLGKKDIDQAMQDCNTAISINPDHPAGYYMLAHCYLYKKDFDNAWKYLHEAENRHINRVNPIFLNDLKKASGRDK